MLFDVDIETTDINGRDIKCTMIVHAPITEKDLAEEIACQNFSAAMQALADLDGYGPSVRKFIDESMTFTTNVTVSQGL